MVLVEYCKRDTIHIQLAANTWTKVALTFDGASNTTWWYHTGSGTGALFEINLGDWVTHYILVNIKYRPNDKLCCKYKSSKMDCNKWCNLLF